MDIMYDEETIKIIKKRLEQSKKISSNQYETIEDILNSNRRMINKNQRR